MNAYRSAIDAGYSHSTAANAHRALEKRIGFKDLLLKNGLDDSTVIKVLGEGLNATRAVPIDKVITDDDGKMLKITEIKEHADHGIRHKFLETFMKVRGDLKDMGASLQIGVVVMPTIKVGEKELVYNIGSPDTP